MADSDEPRAEDRGGAAVAGVGGAGPAAQPEDPRGPQSPSASEVEAADRDLGFGSVVATASRLRLLNRDGSFNVVRRGLGMRAALSLYHRLLTMRWPLFLALLAALYLAVNLAFALAYRVCGAGALVGVAPTRLQTDMGSFARAFFFSVHTFSTIGYGDVVPGSLAAELLVVVEAGVGLLSTALVTGLVFARFSRPMLDLAFSEWALVAPYRGGRGFMFRIANRRRNQVIELQARLIFSRLERVGGRVSRRFHDLALERRKVTFFPLSWTVVHPIDESSPLHGLGPGPEGGLEGAEFLVLLTGLDETFNQVVHTRTSYKGEEVVWNARFHGILEQPGETDPIAIDVRRISDHEVLER